ncbi:MAG: serine/threonine-protein kinase [Polyangiaceae bacterium]
MRPYGLLRAGSVFAQDYLIERHLSDGGMGSVFVAEQISTGRKRALKVFDPKLLEDDKARERFGREARVGARIQSDHIVEVVGGGVDPEHGVPWIAMELLEGEELGAHLARRGPLPMDEILEICRQLTTGLAAAHEAGIVHRDLKPENVYLAKARRPDVPFTLKILDFGIAKFLRDARTKSTDTIGTPLWMSPEQTERGGAITPATDVWPIGLMVFLMFTGRSFWLTASEPEPSSVTLMREVLFEPIPPASERARALGVGDRLPPGFDPWFAGCVTRDARARFPGAREAYAALAELRATPLATTTGPSIQLVVDTDRPARPSVATIAVADTRPCGGASCGSSRPR